jgi:hypothetical protein
MEIEYKRFNFRTETLAIIEKANEIIADYEGQGYTLTLRQLYYQFVAKDLIENSERSYKRLGNIITDGRYAGMIDWLSIEDNHRTSASEGSYNEDEEEAVRGIEGHIAYDFWARQEYYVEVWVEKDALLNVVSRACDPYMIPNMACKGYLSASEAWRAGQRFEEKNARGKHCVLLHLGDHDPSGIDMTRDNIDRLELFAGQGVVDVRRLALNLEQVHQYKPPPNPAKVEDSRSTGYIAKYGSKSWELDALSPSVVNRIISKEIDSLINQEKWDEVEDEQEEARKIIASIHGNWGKVRPFLKKLNRK